MLKVWSIEQPEWTCKIDEGSAGLIKARWAPDGRHILTTAEFHVRFNMGHTKWPHAMACGSVQRNHFSYIYMNSITLN